MPDEPDRALGGITVIDLSQYLAGPMLAMMLGDCGADVIRIDPPGGPVWRHPANAALQRGKRSIVLDLRVAADVQVACDLVADADVVIEGFRPGTLETWGLSYADISARNPRLIWCSLPGFGRTDPRARWRAWEGVICSAAGLYPPKPYVATGGPRFTALPVASTFAAMVASHSVTAALLAREQDGRGDFIEIPLFDAAFAALSTYVEDPHSAAQVRPTQTSVGVQNPAGANTRYYRAGDGSYVGHCGLPPRGISRFWDTYLPLGLGDRTDEAGVDEATHRLTELFRQRDAVSWERLCQDELAAPYAAVQTSRQWLHDDHALSSGNVIAVDDPVLGLTRQAGFAVGLSSTPLRVRHPRRVPGADGDAIREQLSSNPTTNEQKGASAPRASGGRTAPLAGVRVVDYTALLAGPMAGRVLAEYGADVIKINNAAIGLGRGNPTSDDPSAFAGHRTTNAGKRTMYLDLNSARGQEISNALISTADVVHVNFAPATANRLGVGEDAVRAADPSTVYSCLNLHSRGGWRESHRGHEHLAQAVTGMSLRFGGDAPVLHAIIVNDHATGHLAAFGILLALLHRRRSGRGQRVETSLSRTSTLHQLPFMVDFDGQTWDEPTGPDAVGWNSLDRLYQTSDGWIYLAAVRAGDLSRISKVEGLAGADEWLATDRESELSVRFKREAAATWQERLRNVGVAAQEYLDIATVAKDPLVRSRGLVVERNHPGLGWGREIGFVTRFSSYPDRKLAPACAPGQHTSAILDELGFTDNTPGLLVDSVVAGSWT